MCMLLSGLLEGVHQPPLVRRELQPEARIHCGYAGPGLRGVYSVLVMSWHVLFARCILVGLVFASLLGFIFDHSRILSGLEGLLQ